MDKMAIGRSLEALHLKLFMFPSLAFPKRLEKKSSRVVKSMVKELAHLISELNSDTLLISLSIHKIGMMVILVPTPSIVTHL